MNKTLVKPKHVPTNFNEFKQQVLNNVKTYNLSQHRLQENTKQRFLMIINILSVLPL